MLKNDQTHFKNLAVLTPLDFEYCVIIFQHYKWKGERFAMEVKN